MPSLLQTLPANDLGFTRIAASLWGLELSAADPAQAAAELAEALLDAELMEEIIATLPAAAQTALKTLMDAGGRIAWVQFSRQFGEIREMGPGKRDREQPHARPNSATETLYYRALLGKAFFETPSGPQEFAFIPDDFIQALEFMGFESTAPPPEARQEPQYAELAEPEYEPVETEAPEPAEESAPPTPALPAQPAEQTLGRPASPAEKAHILPASGQVLDDAATLLAALRLEMEAPALGIPTSILTDLLTASRLIEKNAPRPEAVKTFLEIPRTQALAALVEAWQTSPSFNELRQLPGLAFEGGWENQPLVTREFLLQLLEPIPEGQWWSLPAFVRDIKQKYPDFQRPAGDYDSWFIKRVADNQYLRGFAHWDEVDGQVIRHFFQVLHWLGQIDLATPEETDTPTAFRLLGEPRESSGEEKGKITATSSGRINVERLAPRAARYQIARFTDWETSPTPEEYRYQLSTRSLKRAAEQGLKVSHLLGLLAKYTGGQVPPVLVKALQRWETSGTEARVETLVVLKVSRPAVLEELRKSKAGRFLGEVIGPTTVCIQSGAEAKVMAALAEMGLLAEAQI